MTTIPLSSNPTERRMIQSVTPLMTQHLCGCLEVNGVVWLCPTHCAAVTITTENGKTAVNIPAELIPKPEKGR